MRIIINVLATTVFFLALFGIVVVASATEKGTITDFSQLLSSNAVKQVLWLVIALAVGFCVSQTNYQRFKQPGLMLAMFLITVVLLALVFAPGIGHEVKGSHRWINLRFFKLQPSEFAKLVMIILTCAWIDHVGWRVQRLLEGILWPGLAIGTVVALLLAETDVGATMVLLIVCGTILFAAGVKLLHLIPAGVLGILLLVAVMLVIPSRRARIVHFANAKFNTQYAVVAESEEKAKQDQERARHQAEQSKLAFINGGAWGVGYMQSMQKKYYLPEAHTDFIFPTIGEELGLAGTLLIVFCYVLLTVSGIAIAINARDVFGMLMGVGLTVFLSIQAALNIGVTTKILPNKGIPLPFISYGGSNLLFSLAAVGILLSIYRKSGPEPAARTMTRPKLLTTPRI